MSRPAALVFVVLAGAWTMAPCTLHAEENVPEAAAPDEALAGGSSNASMPSDPALSPSTAPSTAEPETSTTSPADQASDATALSAWASAEARPYPADETSPLFVLRTAGMSLGFLGSLQVLVVPFIQDPMASLESGSIANAEGFRLRRARLGIEGELPFHFGYRLLLEHGALGANVLDANLSYQPWPFLRLTAGALKVPFSGIMMRSAEYQSFVERPYIVRAVAPDRALGGDVSGQLPWLTYHLGVFNGGGDFFRGDNNTGMLYAARVEVHPLGPLAPGELTVPERFLFQFAVSYFFNQDATGNRHAANGDLALAWWRFKLEGELMWSSFRPAGRPVTDEGVEYGHTVLFGGFAQLGCFLVVDDLQLAARFESQRFIEAVDLRDLNDLWALSGAVNAFFLQGRIKVSLVYEHRHEWRIRQVRNDFLALQLQGRI